MDQDSQKEYTFEYLWRCYTDNIFWKNFGGFDNWWKIPFLERGSWRLMNFSDGWMPYNTVANRMYSPAIAFCLNYIPALMELLVDHECEGIEIPPGEEPPEDGPQPCRTNIICEFLKTKELQDYLKDEFKPFLKIMRQNWFKITFNPDRTIIGFYKKVDRDS